MKLPSLWCEEQIIKINVDRLTHIKTKNYIWEFDWYLKNITNLAVMKLYRDVNISTMCIFLTKLKEIK